MPKAAAFVFNAFVLLPMAMVSVAVNPPSMVLAFLPIAMLSLPVIELPASWPIVILSLPAIELPAL